MTALATLDLGEGWPVLLVAIGAIVVLLALFGGPNGDEGGIGPS